MDGINLFDTEDLSEEEAKVHSGSFDGVLEKESKDWKDKEDYYEKIVENLRGELKKRAPTQTILPMDVVARLNRLERDNQLLRAENSELKNELNSAERDNAVLCHENTGKSKKLRGANKKVEKAKNVAGKEEEKAKSAVQDKNHRLTSERKMRKERNKALANYEEQKKTSEDLRAELKIERSGRPHLREDGTESDETTVAIPIEFKIHRAHFKDLVAIFESNQMVLKDKFTRWYEEWEKPKEVRQVVGANYVEDDRKKTRIGMDLYEDFIEGVEDRYMGLTPTGAEHDGKRSKRSLEAICRQNKARYNNSY
ncbi:hypothetical protein BS50DRAFT_677566 [Corynespora cassiicola Philippines]|uniref:Uncharacterized protein n=1 Tax=Corynespora cassiicola Philippines TaxID=1448308 RepID=A0A2T2NLM8_CORCC|nr:hypothetical protein BS50DRAFT_677566 [Corynespora cassiicola Philippines]